MGRFLVFFSYIGTHYRGLQIQRQSGEVISRFKTVQGVLEEHLRMLKATNDVMVKTSSRTDKNVHALSNTCHVDLIHWLHPREFNPLWITSRLNYYLLKSNEKLRILNTVRVSDDFNCRRDVKERRYVYRLAFVKNLTVFTDPARRGLPWNAQDADLSSRVYPPFDLDLFLKAAKILSGTHNFMSFSTKNCVYSNGKIAPNTRMTVGVRRGSAWMGEHQPAVSDSIDYWEVHFHSLSFLYKQVRRMVGAMVMVAKGKMTLEELQYHLDNPSLWNPGKIQALSGFGLILKEVHYPEHVFSYNSRPLTELESELSPDKIKARSSGLQETVPPASQTSKISSDLSLQQTIPSANLLGAGVELNLQENRQRKDENEERTCVDDVKSLTNLDTDIEEGNCVPENYIFVDAIDSESVPLGPENTEADSVSGSNDSVWR